MGRVSPIVSPRAVDDAWKRYVELTLAENSDPHLRVSRDHVQRRIRAHDDFYRLYLRTPEN